MRADEGAVARAVLRVEVEDSMRMQMPATGSRQPRQFELLTPGGTGGCCAVQRPVSIARRSPIIGARIAIMRL